jgi:uncharacterized protein YceH (UPF0502 family)
MASIADLAAAEAVLTDLAEREPPLVVLLPRQPGRKEQRYAHLFAGIPELSEETSPSPEPVRARVLAENERLTALELEIAALRSELVELRAQLATFRAQFE